MNVVNHEIMEAQSQVEHGEDKGGSHDQVSAAEPSTIVLGEIVTCWTCRAHLDGLLRQSKDGFCPRCGQSFSILKNREKRRLRLLRQHRIAGVL